MRSATAGEHGTRVTVTIAGHPFDLSRDAVAEAVAGIVPDPVTAHFVVVDGRRYPPKQVLALATGMDRADFTTHQARRTLRRLGFAVGRRLPSSDPREPPGVEPSVADRARWPFGGRQADALRPHRGRWVGLRAEEVLVVADSRAEVVTWMRRHDRTGAVLHVPPGPYVDGDADGANGIGPTVEGWTSRSTTP